MQNVAVMLVITHLRRWEAKSDADGTADLI